MVAEESFRERGPEDLDSSNCSRVTITARQRLTIEYVFAGAGFRPAAPLSSRRRIGCFAERVRRAFVFYRSPAFSFRQPPALLLAMICLNIALSAGALTFSP